VRPGVLAVVCALAFATAAHADPQLEASGFTGVVYLPEASQLGDSWAPEQVPGTAPLVGARLNMLGQPLFEQNGLVVQMGVELELAMAAAFTGGTAIADGGRMSYFAPVFGWRAHLFTRITANDAVQLHLVAGAGGETVASSSPFMRKETDPVLYWGPGFAVPVGDGAWQIRVDGRHGLMPAKGGGLTSTFEVQLGVATVFGLPQKTRIAPPRRDVPPPQPIVDDDDGCPEPDGDGDNVIGDADKCPDQAEDLDGFEDADGCPELDNDGDGLADVRDKCPLEPEVRNGFEDDDGCADTVPVGITKTLAGTQKVTFEPNRARVTSKAKEALANVVALLNEYASIKIVVIAHPANKGGDELARRRADAVKWHMIDEGMIAQDRVETRVGDVKKSPIELQLIVR
jgi:OOP family OmpA-OmpF porin